MRIVRVLERKGGWGGGGGGGEIRDKVP
jgi:hypothetical protein